MRIFLALLSIVMITFNAHAGSGRHVNIYIWAEYVPDSIFAGFTKTTGIKVNITTYSSPEELYAKIRLTGGKGYDLIMANPEYMTAMKNQKLLQIIDRSKISNFKHIDPNLLTAEYNPCGEYTIPFTWGTSSFAVNSKKVDLKNLQSFADLARPEFNHRILLLDDLRAVLGMGLMLNGHSINDKDEAHIKQAYETVKDKILPNVKSFGNESAVQSLLNGEVDIAQTWSGFAYLAHQSNPDIVYVHMKEGIDMWIDNVAILSASEHVEDTYKLIDYLYTPEVMASIIDENDYSSVIPEVRNLLPEEKRNSPILNMTAEEKKRAQLESDLGDALKIYEKYWTKLRSTHD